MSWNIYWEENKIKFDYNKNEINLRDLIVANYLLVHQDMMVIHQVNLNTKKIEINISKNK
jgi:hypothetical protein